MKMEVVGGTRTRLTFFNHVSRILVVAERHKFRMAQTISFSPLQKLNHNRQLGTYPDALLHLPGVISPDGIDIRGRGDIGFVPV